MYRVVAMRHQLASRRPGASVRRGHSTAEPNVPPVSMPMRKRRLTAGRTSGES